MAQRTGLRKRPSDAARWSRCAKAPSFTANYPNDSNDLADEGTAAHWVRQQCLDFGFDPYDFIGTKVMVNGKIYVCDDEMAEHLQEGIDEIREFDGKLFVEHWVDTTEWVGLDPDGNRQGGTLDAGVVGSHLVVVSDLKFGRGIPVQAVRNDQQRIYLLAFYHQVVKHISKATDFLIIIDQPRNAAGGGYWHVSLDELLEYGEFIKKRAALVDSPNAEFTPGKKQCQWCPAANVPDRPGGCPAHARWSVETIDLDFEELENAALLGDMWMPPTVELLTPERLIHISLNKGNIEKFLEYCHAQALTHLMTQGPIAGQKAVNGRRPPRKYTSEDAAEAFLRQKLPSGDPFNKKLKTASQAEKEIGKKYEIPAALVERGQPKPVMVSVDDKRPAIRTVESEFDDVNDPNETKETQE